MDPSCRVRPVYLCVINKRLFRDLDFVQFQSIRLFESSLCFLNHFSGISDSWSHSFLFCTHQTPTHPLSNSIFSCFFFFFLPVSTAQLAGLLGGTTCIWVIFSLSISHFHFNSGLTAGTKALRMQMSMHWLFFSQMERVGREGAMNAGESKFTQATLAEWESNLMLLHSYSNEDKFGLEGQVTANKKDKARKEKSGHNQNSI